MTTPSYPHQPVMLTEVMAALAPCTGCRYLDGTLGAGGHSEAILQASAPDGTLTAFDLDLQAMQIAEERLKIFGNRVRLIRDSYANAEMYFKKEERVDGILLDLGVSSMQLDQADRGFSFNKEGTLDMRFSQSGKSAEDLVNQWDEDELARILWEYGEERASRKIAAAIVRARSEKPLRTTKELASVIASILGRGNSRIHPATKSFQAIRIAVNSELDTIERALPAMVRLLRPGGRLAVISFHSLEDRIVKLFFRRESTGCLCPVRQPICTCGHAAQVKLVKTKALQAEIDEIEENTRARSAKLRVIEKLEVEN